MKLWRHKQIVFWHTLNYVQKIGGYALFKGNFRTSITGIFEIKIPPLNSCFLFRLIVFDTWWALLPSKTQYTGCPAKRYIQFWRTISNIFFQQKASKIYKYKTLMTAILVITSFFPLMSFLGEIIELYLK